MVLLSAIANKAEDLGFYHVAVAPPEVPPEVIEAYDKFIAMGYHGTMAWLANHRSARQDATKLFAPVKQVIILTHPYCHQDHTDQVDDNMFLGGVVARYARGIDYHRLLKNKMMLLARWLAGQGIKARPIVDSAPFFEKPMAARAGIGWQGKHTNLLARELGNWFFIAELLVDGVITDDRQKTRPSSVGSCGSCHACISACPTRAIVAPYKLDARRCISYLTIEHDGMIPKEFRHALSDMLFGCDICLAVCPFNKFAETAHKIKMDKTLQENLQGPSAIDIAEVLTMTTEGFAKKFASSSIRRLGRDNLVRNGLMVLANRASQIKGASGRAMVDRVIKLLDDNSAVVRGSAVWALQHVAPAQWQWHRQQRIAKEKNPLVLTEWRDAAATSPTADQPPPPHP